MALPSRKEYADEVRMPRSRITSKGQITLPKTIRDALNVGEGDAVSFIMRDDGTVTVEAVVVDVRDLFGTVRTKIRGITIEQMKDTVRRAASHK